MALPSLRRKTTPTGRARISRGRGLTASAAPAGGSSRGLRRLHQPWQLKALGFKQVRVRHHGDVARIEVDGAEIERLVAERDRVVEAVRAAGYKFVSADLEGYTTGSLNRTWRQQPNR